MFWEFIGFRGLEFRGFIGSLGFVEFRGCLGCIGLIEFIACRA